jgi:hypothetical protein
MDNVSAEPPYLLEQAVMPMPAKRARHATNREIAPAVYLSSAIREVHAADNKRVIRTLVPACFSQALRLLLRAQAATFALWGQLAT